MCSATAARSVLTQQAVRAQAALLFRMLVLVPPLAPRTCEDLCAEAQALLPELVAQLGAHDAVGKAGEVFHVCGGGQLPARRDAIGQPALKQDGVQLSARAVDCCRVCCRAAAYDGHAGGDLFQGHAAEAAELREGAGQGVCARRLLQHNRRCKAGRGMGGVKSDNLICIEADGSPTGQLAAGFLVCPPQLQRLVQTGLLLHSPSGPLDKRLDEEWQ